MAVGDIFLTRFNFENPSGQGSMGMYHRETAIVTSEDSCRMIADALHAACGDEVLAALSDDWYWAGIEVRKVFGDPRPVYLRETKDAGNLAAGKIAGPGLPANNSVQFDLIQTTFSARSHGRMNLPGIPESNASGGRLSTAYLSTQLTALAATLIAELVEPAAGAGRWEIGVISSKVRDAALPAKNWSGAFAPCVAINPISIISRQKRRASKVRGFSTVA